MSEVNGLHRKYRPQVLDEIIGHEAAVTRLKGMIASGKVPSAIAFFGSSGCGKTTLARAFAAAINGVDKASELLDYTEYNATANKTMEDVKGWVQASRFKPRKKVRVICIDEAQGLISNPQAAAAFLKPLEEPPANTVWIICSMEPSKFTSTETGRAILKRCNQFVLEEHTPKDLFKQAKRIAKGESMKYVMSEENEVLKEVAKACTDMRSLANLMESLQQYYEGLEDKPKRLKTTDVTSILKSTESADDELAYNVMVAVLGKQYKDVVRNLLDVKDDYGFVTKLHWLSKALLGNAVGARKGWVPPAAQALIKETNGKVSLGTIAALNATIIEVKQTAASFQMPATELLTARFYRLIKEMA